MDRFSVAPWIRLPVLVTSGVLGLSALGSTYLAFQNGYWALGGFEVIVLVAGLFGVLIGLGLFREAPALSVAIIGGACICSALLGEAELTVRLLTSEGSGRELAGPVDTFTLAFSRLVAALVLFASAALMVLTRRPGAAFGRLAVAIGFGLPVVGALGVLAIPGVRNTLSGADPFLLTVLVILAMFVFGILFSVSVHHAIRAFETGLARDDATGRRPKD